MKDRANNKSEEEVNSLIKFRFIIRVNLHKLLNFFKHKKK